MPMPCAKKTQQMKAVRIFISSPGDVQEERETAKQVIQGLRKRYAAYFDLKPVLWEYLPLQADASFQQGVDMVLSTEHGIDVAVFILWSRLGSPLGASILKADGSEYRSGTEREFDLMLKAREASNGAKPHLLVYTRSDEAGFKERLRSSKPEEKGDLVKQKELVTSFIREEFHDSERGTNMRAYHTFDQAASFSTRLRAHLQELLDSECQGLRADPVWDIEEQGPPFRGLQAFEFEHTEVFFGREDEIVAARTSLQEAAKNGCSFLLITGASGAGKSSLARAGVLPAVVENEIDDDVRGWRRAVFTPSSVAENVTGGMADVLLVAVPELAKLSNPVQLAKELSEDPRRAVESLVLPALREASGNRRGSVRLIVLADQLEELFTDERFDPAKREHFASILDALARCGEVWVTATVRGDFYSRCQEIQNLMRLKADGAQIDVLPPRADAIRRMIESPAALSGLSYERSQSGNLADLILAEASSQAELLPLLQDLLEGLFRRRDAEGLLTIASYRELGGISGALAKRAENALAALPPDVRQTLSSVLRQLVSLNENQDGERGATRRRARLSGFEAGSAERKLVDAFVRERLLVADQDEGGESTVTLAHEALIRAWPRVSEWLEENRDFLRQRSRLAQAITQWRAQGSHDDLLLARGLPLTQAEYLLENHADSLSNEEKAFILSSRQKAEAQRKKTARIRAVVIAAISLLLLAALGGLVASYLKNAEAQREKLAAQERENQARAYYDVHSARQAGERGDFRAAVEGTARAFTRHRDFTTRSSFLSALESVPQRLQTSIRGFGGAVTLLSFGDDRSLCVADAVGAMRVLDFSGGKIDVTAARIPEAKEAPLLLAVAQRNGEWEGQREDGTKLSSSDEDGPISLAGRQTLLLSTQPDGLAAAVYPEAPSEVVMTGTQEGAQTQGTSVALPGRISALAASSDGTIAAGTITGDVAVFSSEDPSQSTALLAQGGDRIMSLAWDPSGTGRLVAGDAKGKVLFFDSTRLTSQLSVAEARITGLAWTKDGSYLAVARSDGAVSLLRCAPDSTPSEVETLSGHSGPCLSVAWSQDSSTLASGGEDAVVCLWSPFAWPGPFKTLSTGRDLRSMSVSSNGKQIAAGSADGAMVFTDTSFTGRPTRTTIANSAITTLDWKPHSNLVLSGDAAGQAILQNPGNEEPVAEFFAPGKRTDKTIWRARWSADGNEAAYTSQSGAVVLIQGAKTKQKEIAALEDYALGIAWSPDANTLAVGSTDGKIRFFARTGKTGDFKPQKQMQIHNDSIGALAYSPDGRLLASCGNDGTVSVVQAESGELAARSIPAGCYLEDIIFSSDGKLIYAVGADGHLRAWAGDTAEPWMDIAMSDRHLWALDLANRELYIAGNAGDIQSLDASEEVWEIRAREIVGKDISKED